MTNISYLDLAILGSKIRARKVQAHKDHDWCEYLRCLAALNYLKHAGRWPKGSEDRVKCVTKAYNEFMVGRQ